MIGQKNRMVLEHSHKGATYSTFVQKTLTTDGPMAVNESRNNQSLELQKIHEARDNDPFAFDASTVGQYAWLKDGGNYWIAPVPTHQELPPGYYVVCESMQGYYLKPKQFSVDELYLLPDPALEQIAEDIVQFWGKKAAYERYKITYKRAILMHGKQGNGKTSVINFLIMKLIKEYGGYIFDYGYGAEEMVRKIRMMHPEKHCLIIMEEIDTLMSYDGHRVLNFLDGTNSISDVVTLATTNYLNRLEPRIINRPSRFDRVMEIPVPTPMVREFFLKKKLLPEDLQKINLSKWVADTEKLTLSHLKELIISVFVLEKDYEEVLKIMKSMNGDD